MERGGIWLATFRLMNMEGHTDTDVDLVLAGILLEVLSDTWSLALLLYSRFEMGDTYQE